jgi:hypothetical protein
MKRILWDHDYRQEQILSLCDRTLWPRGRTEDEIHADIADDEELNAIDAGRFSITEQIQALLVADKLETLPNGRYRSVEAL